MLYDRTSSAYRLFVNSSGSVGIGTQSPNVHGWTKALSVDGGTSSSSAVELNQNGTKVGALSLQGDQRLQVVNHTSNPITFHTNGIANERMRIDSSGNLLVGQTSASVGTVGGTMYADGTGKFTVDGSIVSYFNRLTSDGTILSLRKDTTEVGSIGTNSGYMVIGSPVGTDAHLLIGNGLIHPATSTGAAKDASIDIGGSSNRFKDLYLSNAAYLDKVIGHDDTNTYISFIGADVTQFVQGGAESMRLDASGNLLVGKDSTNFGFEGAVINNNGSAEITKNGGSTLFLNRKTSDGDIASFYKDGSAVGSIGCNNNDPYIARAGGNGFRWYSGAVVPTNDSGATADNAMDLGSSIGRFDDIYATNSTIQTSDRNEKQDIEELSDAEQRVAVACKGLLRKYRWKSSVEEKGDDARIHFGIIAQDLQDAFTAEGLDAGRYGMFINSTWTDEETGEERSRMGVRYSELLAFIISAI